MTTVVLCGENGEKICDEICKLLSVYGVLRISNNVIIQNCRAPKFCIIQCNNPSKLQLTEAIIVIVGRIMNPNDLILKGKNIVAIVYSSDKTALRLLKNTNISVITCGMAEEDTISLSSNKDDSAIVSINRKMKNFKGNIIEPQEHKINIKTPLTDYSLLAATALIFSSGETQPEN